MSVSPARLFIGSSVEGRDIGRHLQVVLERAGIEVTLWDQDVFEPGGYALDSLAGVAAATDFAVLIATPDDVMTSRGETTSAVRDNIVLEFGFFAGAIGRERTYLLSTGNPRLPSDVLGLTRLTYQERDDGKVQAAVNGPALQIEKRVANLGPRKKAITAVAGSNEAALAAEIDLLCTNARAQGWAVKSTATTIRLRSPHGSTHTLSRSRPDVTRERLRAFATELRADGLRVNSSVRGPMTESPF